VNGFIGYNFDFVQHNTTNIIHYDVICPPAQSGTVLDVTEITSHELAESVTDPEAATGHPAWEDDHPPTTSGPGHQIGDIVELLPNAGVALRLNGHNYWVQTESDRNDQGLDPNSFVLNRA
jgi:hypothetical protein